MLKRIMIFLASILLLLNSALVNASIGGWTLSNPTAVGASILYDGTKGAANSSILISPNASQVAKVLRGGIVGIALSFAVEQLLGAVDWVLDPENNQIRYTERDPSIFNGYQYCFGRVSDCWRDTAYDTTQLVSNLSTSQVIYKFISVNSLADNDFSITFSATYSANGFVQKITDKLQKRHISTVTEVQEKTLSLETAAQQVIENAESDNLDAQFSVLAAATNILSEAEQDDAKAKPIEDELERNSEKCPNGESRNIYGQCWICPQEDKQPIESNKNIAKVRAQALGSCVTGGRNKVFKNLDKDEFMVRSTAWDTLAEAREAENMCWLPPHANHVQEAQTNRGIAETCRAGAAQAIKE